MSLEPRGASSLDHTKCWDSGFVKTRLEELTRLFIAKFTHDDLLKMAMKAKRSFKPVPMYHPENPHYGRETFSEKARKKAEKVLEQERQNYVDGRAEKDKTVIVEIARKLRFMVWSVNEEGQPEKLKIIVERGSSPHPKGGVIIHDVMYVADHDFVRFRQIIMLKNRLEQLRTYAPYYSKEIKKLYEEAMDLATLEVVRKEG